MSSEFEAKSQEEADETLKKMLTLTEGKDSAFPWEHYWFLITGKRALEVVE